MEADWKEARRGEREGTKRDTRRMKRQETRGIKGGTGGQGCGNECHSASISVVFMLVADNTALTCTSGYIHVQTRQVNGKRPRNVCVQDKISGHIDSILRVDLVLFFFSSDLIPIPAFRYLLIESSVSFQCNQKYTKYKHTAHYNAHSRGRHT